VNDSDDAQSEDPIAELRAALQRAIRRVCPRWLVDRREDLVQVAVMRVLEARGRSDGATPLAGPYLYRVAYTTLVDEIRRSRRRPEAPLEDSMAETVATPRADPEEHYAARQLGQAIRACLARLVRPRRLAVTLHLQGHTVPQAASLLGWNAKRTENLVYRGLADLRRCLEAKGIQP
jgi:RNA polymerase sigma-70 factor, ECF subfamily